MHIDELDTPAVLIDLDVLERNIARMAEAAREAGVGLRPHAKTHKLPEVARMQLAAGAIGISLAKVGEAEAFADAGLDDIFIAYPIVGADKARRLLALPEHVRLTVGVDSVAGAGILAGPFATAGRKLDVRLKIDSGFHRVGVLPAEALEVAREIAALNGLNFRGVFTHAGHGYHADSPEAVAAIGKVEGDTVVTVAETLRADGIVADDVSVGSTPTARSAMTVKGVTEARPGNYVYHDRTQVGLGTCGLEDCTMSVLATVVSAPARDRAVLDAGSKTLSSDGLRPEAGGFGAIVGTDSTITRLSEEHGVVGIAEADAFVVGQRVRVIPNHSCVVSNLHDQVHAVRGDRVEATWRVAARGRVS